MLLKIKFVELSKIIIFILNNDYIKFFKNRHKLICTCLFLVFFVDK